ncbi:diguanylate cyclase [Mycobacterium antarcticum]|uniref:diguanylate cyclase domain-containing protein n=1 Tax=Mycolicibacterium sp. TUM20985 TaxID=3023370 RepID=UPI0025740567|nr:diguanylate cyclase [Mycolicibacterium sp. TUM20985]BDX30515.1 diguanylate cyclase [Mycolicibacterium sp. TUM20985]
MLAAARRWLHTDDHYYWITAHLAKRGLQPVTCRLTAANMLGLSAIPLLLMLSDLGPQGTRDRWLAGAVSVCCVVMASVWMRSGWPTRLQSQLCVVVGSLCIAVGCFIQSSAALGLTGAGTFTVVSAFTALFHNGRLLAYTWIVGAATLVGAAVRLGEFEPAVAAAGIALFAFTNVFVVFVCRNVVRLVNTDIHYGELEPLTGLLTRDAFADRVATIVSRDRDDDRFLAIVVVSLDSFSLLTAMGGDSDANQARVAIGHRLSETVRRDAVLAHVGESEYLVADTFGSTDATVLTDRLQHSVRTASYRLTASIGVVVTPLAPLVGHPPHDVVEELITLATTNAYSARREGGQRTTATINPRLTSLENPDSDDLSA